MMPQLTETTAIHHHYLDFLSALKAAGFEGEISPDYAARTVLATDNSIYQILPQAVVYPRHLKDVQRLAQLSHQSDWRSIVLSPRGGGTGTNGQSLTDGILVDLSRHLNRILEINAEAGWVRVEAGVVKDQLNAALKPHGYFFAPELSTSNRATIGGMINTDASGQGSVLYGKTRDHVLELSTVLLDGCLLTSQPMNEADLADHQQTEGLVGQIHRTVAEVDERRHADIQAHFPKLNRCLTGYDLAHIRDDHGQFNLNNLLCGSEGTLGFVCEAKLNILPIPSHSALAVICYRSFDASLRDAQRLMSAEPASIETIDSFVLDLAKTDIIWHQVAPFFAGIDNDQLAGINLVEYTAHSEQALQAGMAKLTEQLNGDEQNASCLGYSIAWGKEEVNHLWAMRKRAVGLLGNAQGEARPVAFVEDTAVPPEHLADFIADFRAVLDKEQLRYGMFGHVDAGVLHVRPALDMKNPEEIKRVRRITDQVVALTQRYGGLLWGEHGKGVRSEFTPQFFGDLYPELQAIKRAFDPYNQLNPGKIATPSADIPLLAIDAVTTRGELDRTIPIESWQHQAEAVYCNGNGACFNADVDDAMCPSFKATGERKYSPKGRASLIREWIRLLGEQGFNTQELAQAEGRRLPLVSWFQRAWHSWQQHRGQYDFSHEVYDSMAACLSCKSCTGQCPVKVDVPEFRAKFLQLYYGRYLRPAKDYFIGLLEFIVPWLARQPLKSLYNGLIRWPMMAAFLRKAGMVDSPNLHSLNPVQACASLNIRLARPSALASMSADEKQRSLVIVQDAFTSFFDTKTLVDILDCLQRLGFIVWLMPYAANGKPLHVHGFLQAFRWVAKRRQGDFVRLAKTGIPLVGIEPSMTLAYRSEYLKYLPKGTDMPSVLLLQEFLAKHPEQLKSHRLAIAETAHLLGHCTEKTNAAASMKDWQSVFEHLGIKLEQPAVGCCGMAGTYGHEARNVGTSADIYDLSWRKKLTDLPADQLVATGYSCRSQVKRMQDQSIAHPLQFVRRQLMSQ